MKFSDRHRKALAWLSAKRAEIFSEDSSFTLSDAQRLRKGWDSELAKSPRVRSRGWIYLLGPATAVALVLFFLPSLLSRHESWDFDPQLQSRGPDPHPLQLLSEIPWKLDPDFSKKFITITASNLISWKGSLAPAPELNRFNETNHRFYRFLTVGTDNNGRVITNAGQLDLQSTKSGDAGANPAKGSIQGAQVTSTLSLSNHPPLIVIQVLRPAVAR